MTIQTRQIYGLQHANTNEWYISGRRIKTFTRLSEVAPYRRENHLTALWVAKPLIEKLERAE